MPKYLLLQWDGSILGPPSRVPPPSPGSGQPPSHPFPPTWTDRSFRRGTFSHTHSEVQLSAVSLTSNSDKTCHLSDSEILPSSGSSNLSIRYWSFKDPLKCFCLLVDRKQLKRNWKNKSSVKFMSFLLTNVFFEVYSLWHRRNKIVLIQSI